MTPDQRHHLEKVRLRETHVAGYLYYQYIIDKDAWLIRRPTPEEDARLGERRPPTPAAVKVSRSRR